MAKINHSIVDLNKKEIDTLSAALIVASLYIVDADDSLANLIRALKLEQPFSLPELRENRRKMSRTEFHLLDDGSMVILQNERLGITSQVEALKNGSDWESDNPLDVQLYFPHDNSEMIINLATIKSDSSFISGIAEEPFQLFHP